MKAFISIVLVFLTILFRGGDKRDKINAVWFSQFDMCAEFMCCDEDSVASSAEAISRKLVYAECNTVFLQMHPNGDSMYCSDLFPASRYLSGAYGEELVCDVSEILIDKLTSNGISVYAWINPYRLMTVSEMELISEKYEVKRAYLDNDGTVLEWNGRLYFNPSSDRARRIILSCAEEILCRYPVSGIIIDDYFYPTTSEQFDVSAFEQSGQEDLSAFRRDSITTLVGMLCDTAHKYGKKFAISPAGNIYSLYDSYYLDISLLCEKKYADFISPQIYFGYKNQTCPFTQVLADWERAAGDVPVIPSLAAYKASAAEPDKYAGSAEGRTEWIDDSGVIYRQIRHCRIKYGGCALFSYASLSGIDVDKIKASW